MIGWDPKIVCFGIHSDGQKYTKKGVEATPYAGEVWKTGDVIKLTINWKAKTICIFQNEVERGKVFTDVDLPEDLLFAVSMFTQGD